MHERIIYLYERETYWPLYICVLFYHEFRTVVQLKQLRGETSHAAVHVVPVVAGTLEESLDLAVSIATTRSCWE